MTPAPNQNASQSIRIGQLERDVALLARAVARLLDMPGEHGRWTKDDFAALSAALERLDPPPEPERADEPVVDPTDWETQPQPSYELDRPARLA